MCTHVTNQSQLMVLQMDSYVYERKRNVAFARHDRLVYGNLNRRGWAHGRTHVLGPPCGLLAPLF